MDAAELWAESYQGEVLGETLFGALAERETDPERKRLLDAFTLLERTTKELAEPVFERNGYDRGDVEATAASALATADHIDAQNWAGFLESIPPIADTYLVKYRQLVQLVDNDEDRAVAEAYVAHELALASASRRALGEEDGDPLEPILALDHVAAAVR